MLKNGLKMLNNVLKNDEECFKIFWKMLRNVEQCFKKFGKMF